MREASERPIITLLSDFGQADGYVAAMKGVLASLAPGASVVDICHAIPAQDIARAGIVWASALPYFPRGTVHVGVVDPGVGTRREILAVEARGSVFLVPDNGLLGYVIARREIRRCVRVRERRFFLPEVSSTFHGRDIFAPVAARLALGESTEALGPRARPTRWSRIPPPVGRWDRSRSCLRERGGIIAIDAFGNATTNLRPREGLELVALRCGDAVLEGLRRAYGDVARGRPLALVGSTGYVEIAVREGSAARILGLAVGADVAATWGAVPRPRHSLVAG